jgi:UDP-2,3-diacylglucosamine hydrolase
MKTEARHADALYVLGDLFDFWIGDDDNSPFAQSIKAEFKALTSSGVPCFFTKGNRDFLIGKRFCRQTGITLLPDESVVEIYGNRVLVLHGDTLCIDDTGYLKFRATVHKPWLQWLFNRIPLPLKKKIISKVQADIHTEKNTKPLEIMDVTQSEVERVMQHYDIKFMIHGHTHRPDIHTFVIQNDTCKRIVLGDWYTQGSVLVYDKNSFELQNRPL